MVGRGQGHEVFACEGGRLQEDTVIPDPDFPLFSQLPPPDVAFLWVTRTNRKLRTDSKWVWRAGKAGDKLARYKLLPTVSSQILDPTSFAWTVEEDGQPGE